ncbi:MAG: hypothetical protein J7L66_04915 [Anaerolineaceae bacterium]|nr:hypothetical protein [Anaerolineaceae bacterium]
MENKKFISNLNFIKVIIITFSAILLTGCILVMDDLATDTPDTFATNSAYNTLSPTASEDTIEPIDIKTPTVSTTSLPTSTFLPTTTAAITSTPFSTPTQFPITVHENAPAYIENFAYPEEGCSWMGVAGQVFGEDGKPIMNLVVLVKGKLGGKNLELVGVTGTKEADIYGPGGYEIKIADEALSSENALSIQVFNLEGIPLSDVFFFNTYDDCEKNLVIINFNTF